MKYPYLTVSLLVVFGLIDIAIVGNQFGLDATTWPGWVQAVGSIAALAVAIFVMSRQNENALQLILETERRGMQRRANSVFAIVQRAHKQLNSCVDTIEKMAATGDTSKVTVAWTLTRRITTQLQIVLTAIPTHELGSFDLALGIHQSLDALNLFNHCADTDEMKQAESGQVSDLSKTCELLRKNIKTASDTFKKGMSEMQAQQ